MPSRIQGHPWHIKYLKAKDGRRHRARCIYFRPKDLCKLHEKCFGCSHCDKYNESSDRKLDRKGLRNLNETYQSKSSKPLYERGTAKSKKSKIEGIRVGDIVELLDFIDDCKMKVHIVAKEKACLEENKISEDSPIGKDIIGKQIGNQVEIFTNEKVYLFTSLQW